jgi:Na+/H+ antiporter NhaC
MKISREKLAYISDSSSAPICILIPFNAWGAFIMGLLLVQGFEHPFATMIQSIAYNFYPILAIVLVFIIIITKKDYGPMRKAELRTINEGKLHWDNATPMISDELTSIEVKAGVTPKAINMVVPIATMVAMMPVMLVYTGWSSAMENAPDASLGQHILDAIGQGSGSTSVLVSVITAILVSIFFYRLQDIFKINEMVDLTMKGISGLMPLALLMLLAFAISAVCKELQTGIYVAEITKSWLSPGLVPFLVFLVSCFIAFSTGSSWGTFGIMIAIAIPMARVMDANEILTLAAVLGGGVFGDHCSPISDTTIIASMASATDHIDHVRTQAPYALFIGSITAIIYLIMGLV